jgi:flagellar hook-associated protein 3 FlgL
MGLGLRVTFNSRALAAQRANAEALRRASETQNALATGKRITRPSEDPGAANQVMKLRGTLGDVAQYLRNGEDARGYLSVADGALDEVGALVRRARDLTLTAANSTTSPEARNALAEQIGRIKEQVTGLAATQVAGRYIFSGQKTDTKPFDPADATNAYRGDTGAVRVEVNRGEYVALNVPAEPVFASLLNDLDTIKSDMLAGNLHALSQDGVATMTAGTTRVLEARSRIGTSVNQIDHTHDRLEAVRQEFTVLTSNLEDIDVAEAIVKLQAAETAYQASLASTGRLFGTSLMDYLK